MKSTHPMKTFQALGALISYPTRALIEALPDVHAVIVEEGLVDRTRRGAIKDLMHELQATDLLDLEEQYVALFDRGRATALHLFEHVHGDSRDRGQAMVDLGQVYAAAGFELGPRELPDFLPAMLEFLSYRPLEEAREMLRDCAHILRLIGRALRERGSTHAAVFDALLAAVGEEGLGATTGPNPSDEPDIDALWAEEPAFGPTAGNPSCSAAASGRGCAPPAAA
ncbi:MAG: nitrate reductase molybdenum cofactor assembly chaperone [Burkholderiales bacterium]|nr:nitrate reductase molybdenum cofactor assembly chaperone [Burkholderiales bacterium]